MPTVTLVRTTCAGFVAITRNVVQDLLDGVVGEAERGTASPPELPASRRNGVAA